MRTFVEAIVAGAALTGAAIASPVQALAQDAMQADAQCLALMAMLASKDDARTRNAGRMGTLFYLGRLTARDPNVDLVPLMQGAASQIADPKAVGKRCGAEMKVRGEQLQAAGRAMAGQ